MNIEPKWLWLDQELTGNVFFRARKSFMLENVPNDTQLHLTCFGQYRQ